MTPGVQGFEHSSGVLQRAVPGPLPSGEEWVYEPRWGGRRVLVEITGGTVSVSDEAGRPLTDVASILAEAGLGRRLADAVLDGEIVTNDEEPVLVVSDVLRLYGVAVARQTWTERRGVLQRLGLEGPHVQVAQVYDDGEALLSATRELGLAGVLAKRRDAPYGNHLDRAATAERDATGADAVSSWVSVDG
ncbi:MAG: hypothetical protein ACTHMZ_09120 [Actinomycetes bacterium]